MTATATGPPLAPIDRRTWRLAWVIVFGAFAGGLDASLVNIGLDAIRVDLRTDLAAAQWVASGYLVALAVSLPVCGWLGRRFGPGRVWLAALAAFTVASGLCALAPDVGWLIALRVLQGLAAGLLIPAGQTVLGQAVGPQRLGRVMATLGIAVTLAPALGPVVGGLVLHVADWPWLFLINLPIGALGLALGIRLVPRGTPDTASTLDWFGYGCVGLGLPALVYGLTEWSAGGNTVGAVGALVLGVLGLAAFAVRSLRRSDPLTDLRLFADRRYLAAICCAAFSGAAMFGAGLLFPLYFQLAQGQDVVQTGLSMLAFGGGTAAALPVAGRLTDTHGGGTVAVCGWLAVIAATVPFAVLGTPDPALGYPLLALLGAAVALAAVPPGIAAYQAVRADQLPDATTQVNTLQRIGGALGAGLFTVVLARGLAVDVETAFRTAFAWLAGAAVVSLACAEWLRRMTQ